MEVTQSNPVNTVVAKPVEDHPPSARFTWKIDNFSRLDVKKLYSDVFCVGGYKWRILIYPKGNNADYLSVYLDAADRGDLPSGWNRYAKFSLSLVYQVQNISYSIKKESEHEFNASEDDWGFPSFMPLAELNDPGRGYLTNGTCIIEADVEVRLIKGKDKTEKKIQEQPSAVEKEKSSSSIAEIDTLFTDIQTLLELQTSEPENYSDKEIASAQAILRQCLSMDLASFLQSGKAPELKNSLSIMLTTDSFPSNMVDRTTKFLAEFDERCENYEAAQRDLSEAQENEDTVGELKTTLKQLSSKFMPIRNQSEAVDKEISRLESVLTERKARKARLRKRLEDMAGQATSSKQVLVRAKQDMKLSSIKKEQAEKMIGDFQRSWASLKEIKFEPSVMCEHIDKKTTFHASQIRLKKEQEEKELKREEKAEAHLYTIIKVARNEDLLEQIGKDFFFDLVDHDKVRSFRIQKQMPFNLFKEDVAKEFGIPVQFQRFWMWAMRQNRTYRPNRPLTLMEEAQSVGQLREDSNEANNAELKLFLEVELGPDLRPIAPPEKTEEEILLFFKLYDPLKEEMQFIGRLFVNGTGNPAEILTKLNEMAGFSADEEIELFEEIRFEPNVICDHIDKKSTFRASELEDGDIICFQKSQAGNSDQYRYPDVPSFLEYVRNRQNP